MRLLRRRHDHDRRRARRGAAGRPAARAQGQSLPLHRLSLDRRRASHGIGCGRGGRRRQRLRRQPAPTRSARRSSPATPATRWMSAMRGPAAPQGAALAARPCAHRRASTATRALAVPGVVDVFTWEDVPRRLYSTATHEDHLVDPDDTYMLDNVVRFVGQRVAAVVAETEAAAEAACRLLDVDVRDPARGVRPGRGDAAGRAGAARQGRRRAAATSMSRSTARSAASADGFAAADAVHERTYSTSRVQHVHLETHGSIAWRDDDGRIHVRTSSQAPFIAQQKLCHLFGLRARDVHVFTERVGGGFGGKQEMISEDLCVLATLKTGRPVKWEFTREEQFIGATTRHQMTTRVKLGAKRDGTLTAIEFHVVSNTGAYGGHGGETLAAALGSPLTRLPLRQQEGGRLRGLHQHGPGRRLPRLWRVADDLRHRMRDRRAGAAARARPVRDPAQEHDPARATGSSSVWSDPSDVDFGSYGLDQCLDLVEQALASGRRRAEARRRRLAGRHRHARSPCWIAARRPSTARAREMRLLADGSYHLAVGSTEMGNGSVTSHRQIAAGDAGRARRPDRHHQRRYRPDALRHRHLRQHRHGGRRPGGGADRGGAARQHPRLRQPPHRRADRGLPPRGRTRVLCGNAAHRACRAARRRHARAAIASRPSARPISSPRTVAFNVQGIRLAVHRVTGEIRILHSVHAADIGRLINPMQCRGQIEGAIGMGFGWALTENMVYDADGTVVNPALRNYRIPAFADVPRERGVLRRHLRHDRPARRQVAGRVRDQPGGARDRQCARRRHRRALRPSAADARPHLRRALRTQP